MKYISNGVVSLIIGIPLSIIIYIGLLVMLWIIKKRKSIQLKTMITEFIFLVYIVAILNITGIIGMKFNRDWFINSLNSFGFYIPINSGELKMLILNIALFIPLGVFTPVVFSSTKWNWIKVLIVGLVFSIIIEFLQMFGGRMSELVDIVANVLGALIGYVFCQILVGIRRKKCYRDSIRYS